jgi:hypothetical protein
MLPPLLQLILSFTVFPSSLGFANTTVVKVSFCKFCNDEAVFENILCLLWGEEKISYVIFPFGMLRCIAVEPARIICE